MEELKELESFVKTPNLKTLEVSLPVYEDQGVKLIKDLLNAIPSETQVDLTLQYVQYHGTTPALRDLLILFTAFKLDREVTSILRLQVAKIRLADITDIQGAGDYLNQMFKKDGKVTFLKDEFECDVHLEILETKAVLKAVQGHVRMEVSIFGEEKNSKKVYVELF